MNTLFEMQSEDDLRRHAIAENQTNVHRILIGEGPWALSERQRKILECLRGRQGRALAMTIAELQEKVGGGPREIKADVRDLVMSFRLAIVASRDGADGGYYFATTTQERVEGSENYLQEAIKLLQRVAIIRNQPDILRGLGQQLLDAPEGDAPSWHN